MDADIHAVKQNMCVDMIRTLNFCKTAAQNTSAENVTIYKKYPHTFFYTPEDLQKCEAFRTFSKVVKIHVYDKTDTSIHYTAKYDGTKKTLELHM
jgi:hypothetical protein